MAEQNSEFEERVVCINRVAKVVKGGRRFSFSALVVIGNGTGAVGVGLGKPMKFLKLSAKLDARQGKILFR